MSSSARDLARGRDDLGVFAGRSVREVQANDVHTGNEERAHDRAVARGGSDRGDDLRAFLKMVFHEGRLASSGGRLLRTLKRTISPVVSFRRDPLDRRYPRAIDGELPSYRWSCTRCSRRLLFTRARQFFARRCDRERLGRRSRNARTPHPLSRYRSPRPQQRPCRFRTCRASRRCITRRCRSRSVSCMPPNLHELSRDNPKAPPNPKPIPQAKQQPGPQPTQNIFEPAPSTQLPAAPVIDSDRRADRGRGQGSAERSAIARADGARQRGRRRRKPPAPTAAPTAKPATPAPVAPSASPTAAAVAVHASSAPIASPAAGAPSARCRRRRVRACRARAQPRCRRLQDPRHRAAPGAEGSRFAGPRARRRSAEGCSVRAGRGSADGQSRSRAGDARTRHPPRRTSTISCAACCRTTRSIPTTKSYAGHASLRRPMEPTPPPEVVGGDEVHVTNARRRQRRPGQDVGHVDPQSRPHHDVHGLAGALSARRAAPPSGLRTRRTERRSASAALRTPAVLPPIVEGHRHERVRGRLLVPYAGSSAPSP